MRFLSLIQYFERIEATTKRLEISEILAELFRSATADEIDKIIYLTQEQLLPAFYAIEIGMSEKLLIRTITDASGNDAPEVQQHFNTSGDLGKTTEHFLTGQSGTNLEVSAVYSQLRDLAEMSGDGSVERKVGALAELLKSSSPTEAKYISRFVVGRLRLGVGNATILDALSVAKLGEQRFKMVLEQAYGMRIAEADARKLALLFNKAVLERAYNMCSDLGRVGRLLFEEWTPNGNPIQAQVGYPIRMALCERIANPEDVIKKIGRCSVEPKLDGFRCQIHKSNGNVEIFSRNLERTTPMFPEIVEATKEAIKAKSIIFEGEALSYDELTGELQPFQVTIQRKRKHGIAQAAMDIPLKLFAFDLLYVNGEDWTDRSYSDRRRQLGSVIADNPVIELGHADETDDPAEFSRIFQSAIDKGAEGVVAKRPDGPYKAGARDFNWIKLKRSYKGTLADTVDVCLVGYFNGKGARAAFGIGAVLATVYDSDTDTFKTVSRIGSGFSQEEWAQLREILDSNASESMPPRVDSTLTPDVWIHPQTVVTVMADEITRSAMHTCGKDENGIGYALRFPRAKGFIRSDKNPEDATTVAEIITMSKNQKLVKLS